MSASAARLGRMLPRPGALALTALSAGLFALAFPPRSWRPLAWIALAPWLLALRSASVRPALILALLWTLLVTYLTGDWLPAAVARYFAQPWLVGLGFLLFVAATMAAPYYLAFAAAYRLLAQRFGIHAPLLVAAAWVAVELGRGRLFNGTLLYFGSTPWATLGYSQVGVDTLVQLASLTGVYGISFVLVAVNAVLVEIGLALHACGTPALRLARAGAVAALPAALALGFGHASLWGAAPAGDGTRVAIVQANLDVEARWRSDLYGKNLDAYLQRSEQALADDKPQIVFWPESAMTFFVEREPAYQRAIGRVLAAGGAELVAGAPRTDGSARPRYWNSVYLLSPAGEVAARYDKEHLVPFMEYFPFGIDLLRRSFGRIREFTAGAGAQTLPTRAGPAGILVCNEAMLPHFAGRRVQEGAAYLVNPSNDSWAPDAKFAEQMFDIVSLRAVEQRRWLVRASTSGPSGIVDPWGRVQVRTRLFASEYVVGELAARRQPSVYGRVGDLFGAGCCLVVLAALRFDRRTR